MQYFNYHTLRAVDVDFLGICIFWEHCNSFLIAILSLLQNSQFCNIGRISILASREIWLATEFMKAMDGNILDAQPKVIPRKPLMDSRQILHDP